MKKTVIFVIVLAGLIAIGAGYRSMQNARVDEKIYVAVEGGGEIAVLDTASRNVIRRIDLSLEHQGGALKFAPHNVQVAPDGSAVWVTANAGSHMEHASGLIQPAFAHGDEEPTGTEADEVIVIDPIRDAIVKRLPIEKGVHLAHVVFTPDSATAYVTAQMADRIYTIDAKSYEIKREIAVREKSEPHGLRISPQGDRAYVAMLGGKSLGILDLKTDSFSEVPLGDGAVQTGVTPDGQSVVASLYGTKRLAVYEASNQKVRYIGLPEESQGPLQMYPTPDSRFVYLADQGYYFGKPSGHVVYKVDLRENRVVAVIPAGRAPHGVVVSKDGTFVYVTNLLSGDVSVIDTAVDKEIARVPVGKEPNGISVWSKQNGGTP